MQSPAPRILTLFVLLRFASAIAAHGHDEEMDMNIATPDTPPSTVPVTVNSTSPLTYFNYGEHSGLMLAHILLMIISWVFILPIGVMISIARSRYTLPVQFLFFATNAVGVLLATIYNASTPDLYPNNAHHKVGWILTCVVSAQLMMGVIVAYAGRQKNKMTPVSTVAMEQHLRIHNPTIHPESCRFSHDSGQGTEPNTEGLRSQSISSQSSDLTLHDVGLENFEEDEEEEKQGLMHGTRVNKFLATQISSRISSKALGIIRFFYNAVNRLFLVLGFVALTTGGVTYGGFFMGSQIFSGLAHFIKGGVFFWYGIVTLGRWAGCFADIGWAWNISPSSQAVTAEFVESFLIFFYGATNVFLEHLAAWGSEWSAQDLEHISITIMFIGGGLCGMLIESKYIRHLLNTTPQTLTSIHSLHYKNPEDSAEPKSYRFSMNPLPALVILLLGLMMSSHHQSSMVSTMIHKQWGTLLVGAAFARAASYIVFYLAPPTSIFPGRPPTELITAFCLMAGGVVFMSSSRDTVMAMEANGLDAMFIFTVTMGFITFLMAWVIVVIALKGLAVRREHKRTHKIINNDL